MEMGMPESTKHLVYMTGPELFKQQQLSNWHPQHEDFLLLHKFTTHPSKFTNWKVHLMWFSMLLQISTQANLLLRTLRCGSASDRTSLVQMLGSANNSWNMLRPTFCCCRHLPPRLCFKYKMSIRISGWWAVQAMTSNWRGGRKSWRRKLGQMSHGIEQLLVLQNISWGFEDHDNAFFFITRMHDGWYKPAN